MAPIKEQSLFVKWMMVVSASVVVLYFGRSEARWAETQRNQTTAEVQRAKTNALLESHGKLLTGQTAVFESQAEEIMDLKVAIKAFEIVLGNQTKINLSDKLALEELHRRLKDLEDQLDP